MDVQRAIHQQAIAAKSLLLNIRDVIEDDDIAKEDAIEGETGLKEALGLAIDRLNEIEGFEAAIEARVEDLTTRRRRFAEQAARIKASMLKAMGDCDLRKMELPEATLSVRAVRGKVMVTSEADIPSEFWKDGKPSLDKTAIKAALDAGAHVPGAELSNGGETLAVLGK